MKTVLNKWVHELSLKDQSALISVIRGCDAEDMYLKEITKMLRHLIVNNFCKNYNYSNNSIMDIKITADFIEYLGSVESKHWKDHVVSAISIIAKYYPNDYIRVYWTEVESRLKTMKKLPDFMYRIIKEQRDLFTKIEKLEIWLSDKKSDSYKRERQQLVVMKDYNDLLLLRIHDYVKDNNLTIKDLNWYKTIKE